MYQTREIKRRETMGLSPLPQHSFPVPKPLFESDRSSSPRCSQVHKEGWVLTSVKERQFIPAASWTASRPLQQRGVWLIPAASAPWGVFAEHHQRAQHGTMSQNKGADPKILHLETAICWQTLWLCLHKSQVFFQIRSLFKKSYWFHHTWRERFPAAV